MNRGRTWIAVAIVTVAAGGAGVLVGRGLGPSKTTSSERSVRAPSVRPLGERGIDRAALREELAALRDDLRDVRHDQAEAPIEAADDAPPAATQPTQPTSEQAAAGEKGRALLDDAIASGRWQRDHSDELRRLLPRMSPAESRDLLEDLAVAINQQQITSDGPIFR